MSRNLATCEQKLIHYVCWKYQLLDNYAKMMYIYLTICFFQNKSVEILVECFANEYGKDKSVCFKR